MNENRKNSTIMETNTGLNSWFRQQGSSKSVIYESTKKPKKSKSLKLPKLSTSELDKPRRKNSFMSLDSMTDFHTKHFFDTSEQVFTNCHVNSLTKSGTFINENRDLSRTPDPSSFYLRCIDDVIRSNQPSKQIYDEPSELTYVQSLPHLKYVTFGCGRTLTNLWKIQIFKD